MSPPGNGIFVVRGEMSTLTTAMRRGSRWSSNSYQVCIGGGLITLLWVSLGGFLGIPQRYEDFRRRNSRKFREFAAICLSFL